MIIKLIICAGIWLVASIVCLAFWNALIGDNNDNNDDNLPKL